MSGGFFCESRSGELVIVLERKIHPRATVAGFGGAGIKLSAQYIKLAGGLAGEYRQVLLCNRHIIFINNARHLRKISCRLGLVHIGNRNQAHLKALSRLFQLPFESALLCQRRPQVVLCAQYAKVGLNHPHDEILLGGRQRRLSLL